MTFKAVREPLKILNHHGFNKRKINFLSKRKKPYEIAFNKQKASAKDMLPPNNPLSANEWPKNKGHTNNPIVRNWNSVTPILLICVFIILVWFSSHCAAKKAN